MQTKKFRRVIIGSKGNPYVVSCMDDFWTCNCKSFEFGFLKDTRFQCKHIIKVINDVRRESNE